MNAAGEVDPRPLVVHVIQHLIIGGLENGIVNLINRTPPGTVRHAVACLSHFSDFRDRIKDPAVPVVALGKRPGKDLANYARLWQALLKLRPAIVHSRNFATVDCAPVARLAGVRVCIHGEHGWDMSDLDGRNRKHLRYRRAMRPFITRYVAVSRNMQSWLEQTVGVPSERIEQICNGVDTDHFVPASGGRDAIRELGSLPSNALIIGTVGRMQTVKNQKTLAEAFAALVERRPQSRARLRLVLVGDGPLRDELVAFLKSRNVWDLCWLPGATHDVPRVLRALNVFVLPSLNEGISNTILEAMATGLPVIATRVGGNDELVAEGETGQLVAAQDVAGLTSALERYLDHEDLRASHGTSGRRRVEQRFSLDAMINGYLALYRRFAPVR